MENHGDIIQEEDSFEMVGEECDTRKDLDHYV